jgi:hypothetical protein
LTSYLGLAVFRVYVLCKIQGFEFVPWLVSEECAAATLRTNLLNFSEVVGTIFQNCLPVNSYMR